MTDPTLRSIVVGMGWLSGHMLKYLGQMPWHTTAAIVDVREEALARAKEAYGLPDTALFRSLDEALARTQADVAIVNTPSDLHYAQTRAALEAGLHALVAKPVTNRFEHAAELVRIAAQRNVTLSVGQQIRYNRHYTALREYLASGQLGDVEAAWFMNSKPRPNPANLALMKQPSLYENACHHFDSFLAVFGDPVPEWIACDGFIPSWSPYAGPCMVNALIRFGRPAGQPLHLSYHGGFSSRAPMYEFRIEGSQGALCCHGVHMSNDAMRYERAPALGQFAPAEIDAGIPAQEPFVPFLDAWHGYVNGGAEPPFSGRNNLKVFAMLSAAIESAESGKPAEIAGNPRYRDAFA
jgi:predicted dehydrogenase